MNYSNPQLSNFNQKYGFWASGTIKRILTNETYIGSIVQGKERKISYKIKKVSTDPKNEWYFELVQKIMREKRREKKIVKKNRFYIRGKYFAKNVGVE